MGRELSQADRSVLELLAEHRVVVTAQVAALLAVSTGAADRRIRRLSDRELAVGERIFTGLPAAAWITRRGLRSIDSHLPPPSVDLKGYRHDVGVGWLWLAARSGAFGQPAAVISEREMRSTDARAGRVSAPIPYGVGIGGVGPTGLPKRHYPDLLVRLASSRTLAIELELTQKSAHRLTRIMRGYAGDPRIDGVLYLVPDRRLGGVVQAAARRAGLEQIVHIQLLADGESIEGTPVVGARVGRRERVRPPARRADPLSAGAESVARQAHERGAVQ